MWNWLIPDLIFLDKLTNTAPGRHPTGTRLPRALITVIHNQSAGILLARWLINTVCQLPVCRRQETCQATGLCQVRLRQRARWHRRINKTGRQTEALRRTRTTRSPVWEVLLLGHQVCSPMKIGDQLEAALHHTRTLHDHRPVCLVLQVPATNCSLLITVSHSPVTNKHLCASPQILPKVIFCHILCWNYFCRTAKFGEDVLNYGRAVTSGRFSERCLLAWRLKVNIEIWHRWWIECLCQISWKLDLYFNEYLEGTNKLTTDQTDMHEHNNVRYVRVNTAVLFSV